MALHPNLLASLRPKIRDGFNHVQVNRGQSLMRFSVAGFKAADAKISQGDTRKTFGEWVDTDAPISELALAWLNRRLAHNPAKEASTSLGHALNQIQALRHVMGFEDLDALTDDMMALIASLPLRYTMTFPMPAGLLNHTSLIPFQASQTIKLIHAAPDMQDDYPLTLGSVAADHTLKGFAAELKVDASREWFGDYVQIVEEGYVASGSPTAPVLRAIDKFKAIIGFALAMGLLYNSRVAQPFGQIGQYIVHESTGEGWTPVSINQLPDPMATMLTELSLSHAEAKNGSVGRPIIWTRQLECVFSDEAKSRQLITAAQWYFDALAGMRTTPVLAFVQMMVVLEIIYGEERPDTESLGVSSLLRNRCAYAIGKSANDRKEISDKFKDIYGVRSKIVHTGQNRLSLGERNLFETLSQYCRRSIAHELNLLSRDYEQEKKDAQLRMIGAHLVVQKPEQA